MKPATEFGNFELLKILVTLSKEISTSKLVPLLPGLIEKALYSDNADVCQLIHSLAPEGFVFPNKITQLAEERGKREIIELFNIDLPEMIILKNELAKRVENGVADITNMIPKTEEFDYFDEMEKILSLLPSSMTNKSIVLSYDDILEKLHVPVIHHESDCPSDCVQKTQCQCVREVLKLLQYLLDEAGKVHPIFAGCQVIVAGSLKETTKSTCQRFVQPTENVRSSTLVLMRCTRNLAHIGWMAKVLMLQM